MIISAAVRMFAYRGYDAATLREVADLVGVTRTAVHHYFPGKAPLYRAALDRACEIVLPAAARPETLASPSEGDVRLACALLGTSLAQSHRIADVAPRITSISADLRRICAQAAPAGEADQRAELLVALIVGRWVLTACELTAPDSEAAAGPP